MLPSSFTTAEQALENSADSCVFHCVSLHFFFSQEFETKGVFKKTVYDRNMDISWGEGSKKKIPLGELQVDSTPSSPPPQKKTCCDGIDDTTIKYKKKQKIGLLCHW